MKFTDLQPGAYMVHWWHMRQAGRGRQAGRQVGRQAGRGREREMYSGHAVMLTVR